MKYTDSYTRTDVAQAMVAAAYDAAAEKSRESCVECGGSGERDTGGTMPWGAPALVACDCDTRIRAITPTDAKAALDRIVQEAVKEATQVKPLVWEYPTEYGILMRSRTPIGTYSIHDDEDSAFGRLLCYLHLTDDGDSTRYAIDLGGEGYVEPEEMADRCGADYEARILAALKGGGA